MLLLCNYYVTYRCNAFCEFCHFGDHEDFKNTPYANLNEFKSNVEQLAGLGVKFIDLTGGEPLTHFFIQSLPRSLQEKLIFYTFHLIHLKKRNTTE
jgi:molybdenum cofactor biosynthesis enzyme MoaA